MNSDPENLNEYPGGIERVVFTPKSESVAVNCFQFEGITTVSPEVSVFCADWLILLVGFTRGEV